MAASNLLGITQLIITGQHFTGAAEKTVADAGWPAAGCHSIGGLASYAPIRREPVRKPGRPASSLPTCPGRVAAGVHFRQNQAMTWSPKREQAGPWRTEFGRTEFGRTELGRTELDLHADAVGSVRLLALDQLALHADDAAPGDIR
jgi:hypothetical protein